MIKRKWIILLILGIVTQTATGCGGTSTPATAPPATAPPACPPIQSPVTVFVPAVTNPAEITSITIKAGTTAYNDPGSGYWCSTGQLKLVKVSVSGLVTNNGCFTDRNDTSYPCSVYNALAAVDIQPSRIKFPASPYPVLDYDLSKTENIPYCMEKGWNCGGFAIYQLKDPVPAAPTLAWRYVSSASLIAGSTPPAAEGNNIDHFSTFALVELPAPQPFPPAIKAGMVVASKFIPDEPGTSNVFSVAFLIRDAPDPGMKDQTRLFRFSNPEMQLTVNGTYPAECLDLKNYPTVPEQLTCLFPIDMEVSLVTGVDGVPNQVSITPITGEYEARLFANLEIY
jgi:hypothetical protein